MTPVAATADSKVREPNFAAHDVGCGNRTTVNRGTPKDGHYGKDKRIDNDRIGQSKEAVRPDSI
jgi:hypothetical protein